MLCQWSRLKSHSQWQQDTLFMTQKENMQRRVKFVGPMTMVCLSNKNKEIKINVKERERKSKRERERERERERGRQRKQEGDEVTGSSHCPF